MVALETTSKRNDEDKIELTVTISADEVQRHLNAAYREAGKVRIPGFRPGKAPRRVLENHYGGKEYFQAQATDELLKESLSLAIDAEGYVPLDKPELAELDLVEEGADYCYSTTFVVRPILELSSYEPVQIELPSDEPTPEEIESEIEVMLDYYIDFEKITDRPVVEGDFLALDMETTSGGERIEGISGEDIPYQMGTGSMPPAFEEHLIGMTIGETREFNIPLSAEERDLPDGSELTELTELTKPAKPIELARVVATVKEISAKTKPELTDAWVKEKIEFDSVAEFRNRIADSIRARKQSELTSLRERLTSDELASRLRGEPSNLLITQTEQGIYRDFFATLQQNNQTLDGFLASADITPDAFRADIKKQATEVAAQALALDALARHLAFEVTEDEIREEFASSGAENPDELYRQWKENGRISEIREGMLRVKAARHLKESAEVFEPGEKPVDTKTADEPADTEPASTDDADEPANTEPASTDAASTDAADEPADAKATDEAVDDGSKSTGKEPDGEKTATNAEQASEKADTES
jgi:trigger factor